MTRYEITVDAVVGPLTETALDDFTICGTRRGGSCLAGDVVDQAAFHGLLNRIQDLGLEIIEIQRLGDACPRQTPAVRRTHHATF